MDNLIPGTDKYGSLEILDRPLAVVLNSRQGKTPVGNDPWVGNTVAAVRDATEAGYPIITSIGMNTWELTLTAVADTGCPVVIIIPKEKDIPTDVKAAGITRGFNLKPENIIWMPIKPAHGIKGKKGWWEQRDKFAFSLAARIYPISIRPGGRWDQLLQSDEATGKEIIGEFRTDYKERRKSIPILPKNLAVPAISPWPYITHWTRRSYTPWPGETSADFYRDIILSRDEYPRSAPAALKHILVEKVIRASTEHIRGSAKAVAFTALPPDEAVQLMKWRRRYTRPTFEPYGVCIHMKAAAKVCIKPVEYLPERLESHATPKALQQGLGDGKWPAEAEWRALDDVDLARFTGDDVTILVPTTVEISRFVGLTDFRVCALEDLTGF